MCASQPSGKPVTYMVTGVAPDVQATPTNTLIVGKQVSFSMSTGYEGKVFVPDSVFADAKAVHAAVLGEVNAVVAAQAITGTVG